MLNHKAVARSPLRLRGSAREARDAEIERRYLAGETVREIARHFSLSEGRIYQILHEREVSMRAGVCGVGGRPRGWRDPEKEIRNAEIERRYRAGETLQEIGESLGITREWVRQILEKRGVSSRPKGFRRGLRPQTQRKIAAHRQAIVELKRQGLTNHEIALRLRLHSTFVSRLLRQTLSKEDRRMLQKGNSAKRIPEAQLLEQIREVYRALGPTMRERDYDAYVKNREWTGGWLTLVNRFGSWARACDLAGVSVQTRRLRRKRKDFINRKTCLDAVRQVRDELGHIPSTSEYDCYARTAPELPCLSIVMHRCGGWKGVIRTLLMDGGPQEASGK